VSYIIFSSILLGIILVWNCCLSWPYLISQAGINLIFSYIAVIIFSVFILKFDPSYRNKNNKYYRRLAILLVLFNVELILVNKGIIVFTEAYSSLKRQPVILLLIFAEVIHRCIEKYIPEKYL